MKARTKSGVEKCKMKEIRRDGAAIKWPHQEEEKSVKEGRGEQAAGFLEMDR